MMVHYTGNSRGGFRAMATQRLAILTTASSDSLVFGYETDFKSTFTERMRINNSTGNVGIGTSTPVGKLDVSTGGNTNIVISNDSTDTGYNIISLNGTRTKGSYAGIAGGGTGDNKLYLNSGVDVVIQTGASYTERMRITSGGIVQIKVPSGANQGILFKDTADISRAKAIYDDISGEMTIGTMTGYSTVFVTNNTEKMRITSAGNVGIGGTPTNFGAGYTVLAIDNAGAGGGAIDLMAATVRKMTIAVDSDGPKFETKVDGDPIKFKTNSGGTIAERVRITSSGSVGINTSTPGTYKLNVNGTFYSAGSSLEYKTEISTFDADTNKILELRPVTYQYKDEYKHLGKELKSGTQIGLIAEEVAEVFPELALLKQDEDGETRVRNVDYEKLSILLLSEVQKLRKEVNELKA